MLRRRGGCDVRTEAQDRRLGGEGAREPVALPRDVDLEIDDAEPDQRGREWLVAIAELLQRDAIAPRESELARVDAGRDLDCRRDRAPDLHERPGRAPPELGPRRLRQRGAHGCRELHPPLVEHLALVRRWGAHRLDPDERQPPRIDVALPAGDLGEAVVERGALRGVLDRLPERPGCRREHGHPGGGVDDLGQLSNHVEVQRIETPRAIERGACTRAIAGLVTQQQRELELLARLLGSRAAQADEGGVLACGPVPVAGAKTERDQLLVQRDIVGGPVDHVLEVLDRAREIVHVLCEDLREPELDLGALRAARLDGKEAPPQRDCLLDMAGLEREVGTKPQRLGMARRTLEQRIQIDDRRRRIALPVQHGRALEQQRHHLLIARRALHLRLEPGEALAQRHDEAGDVAALAMQLEHASQLGCAGVDVEDALVQREEARARGAVGRGPVEDARGIAQELELRGPVAEPPREVVARVPPRDVIARTPGEAAHRGQRAQIGRGLAQHRRDDLARLS